MATKNPIILDTYLKELGSSDSVIVRPPSDTWANRASLAALGPGIYRFTDVPGLWYYDGSEWQQNAVIILVNDATGWIIPSLASGDAATYSQSGTTVNVTSTAHGLTSDLNGKSIYLVITGATKWYTNFTYIDGNNFSCTSDTSTTGSGTVFRNINETFISPVQTTILGGLMKKNSTIRVTARWKFNTASGTKTERYYLNTSPIFTPSASSVNIAGSDRLFPITNTGATNKQSGPISGAVLGYQSNTVSVGYATSAIDTTANFDFKVSGQVSVANLHIVLDTLTLELIR